MQIAKQSCADCKFHYIDNRVYLNLCTHEKSKYIYNGQSEFHSASHMRAEHSFCGFLATLFVKK